MVSKKVHYGRTARAAAFEAEAPRKIAPKKKITVPAPKGNLSASSQGSSPKNLSEILKAKAAKALKPKVIPILEGYPSPELKLPRKVVENKNHDAIRRLLYADLKKIWIGGALMLPHVSLTLDLERALTKTRDFWQLERGLEKITEVLRAETKGLKALQEKQGTGASLRASRLLLVSNDGTERFYRICERLMKEHGDRVLFLGLDVDSSRLAEKVVRSEKAVKAILVSDKNSVSLVLNALAASPADGMNSANE